MCISKVERGVAREENRVKAERLWSMFNRIFPDDESALKAVCVGPPNDTSKCDFCGKQMQLKYTKRKCACPHCGNRRWLTAQSWLHGVKKIRVYVGALWLMQNGAMVTPSVLEELSKCSYTTCVNVVKKVALAMVDMLKVSLLAQTDDLRELYMHRSTETPAQKHPSFEQDEMERKCAEVAKREAEFLARIERLTRFSEGGFDDHDDEKSAEVLGEVTTAVSAKESNTTEAGNFEITTSRNTTEIAPGNANGEGETVNKQANEEINEQISGSAEDTFTIPDVEGSFRLSVLHKKILIALKEGELHFSQILQKVKPFENVGLLTGSLMMLAIGGLVVHAGFGDRWRLPVKRTPPAVASTDERLQPLLKEFKDHIQLFKDGISRKNVQLHFAIFWIHKFHESLPPGWLFDVIQKRGKIHPSELREFVSPLLINVFGFDASAVASIGTK